MNGKYALDTNIVIALLDEEPAASGKAAQATNLYIPAIVLGELFYGAYGSVRVQENLARAKNYSLETKILDVSAETADHYGRIKADLKRLGRPIPENDLWIAALSIQHSLTLASRDQHFDRVPGLSLARW